VYGQLSTGCVCTVTGCVYICNPKTYFCTGVMITCRSSNPGGQRPPCKRLRYSNRAVGNLIKAHRILKEVVYGKFMKQ